MLYKSKKEIVGIHHNNKTITAVHYSNKIVWELANSCFGKGYWINEKPWVNMDPWKNNVK